MTAVLWKLSSLIIFALAAGSKHHQVLMSEKVFGMLLFSEMWPHMKMDLLAICMCTRIDVKSHVKRTDKKREKGENTKIPS